MLHASPDRYDCNKCPVDYCDEANPAPYNRWVIPDVIESPICLKPMVTPEARYWLSLFKHYDRGHLLKSGGVYDQPSYYLIMMDLIHNWSSYKEIEPDGRRQGNVYDQREGPHQSRV